MGRVQRSMVAIGVMAIAGFGSVSGTPAVAGPVAVPAAGAAPRVTFDVRPAAPRLGSVITVTVSAPRLKAGTSYKALIERTRFPQRVCMGSTEPVAMRRLPDGRFTATLRPGPQSARTPRPPRCGARGRRRCASSATAPGGLVSTGFAKRAIRFVRGAGEAVPPPIPAHEVSFTLLPGSALTAWAPAGRTARRP